MESLTSLISKNLILIWEEGMMIMITLELPTKSCCLYQSATSNFATEDLWQTKTRCYSFIHLVSETNWAISDARIVDFVLATKNGMEAGAKSRVSRD